MKQVVFSLLIICMASVNRASTVTISIKPQIQMNAGLEAFARISYLSNRYTGNRITDYKLVHNQNQIVWQLDIDEATEVSFTLDAGRKNEQLLFIVGPKQEIEIEIAPNVVILKNASVKAFSKKYSFSGDAALRNLYFSHYMFGMHPYYLNSIGNNDFFMGYGTRKNENHRIFAKNYLDSVRAFQIKDIKQRYRKDKWLVNYCIADLNIEYLRSLRREQTKWISNIPQTPHTKFLRLMHATFTMKDEYLMNLRIREFGRSLILNNSRNRNIDYGELGLDSAILNGEIHINQSYKEAFLADIKQRLNKADLAQKSDFAKRLETDTTFNSLVKHEVYYGLSYLEKEMRDLDYLNHIDSLNDIPIQFRFHAAIYQLKMSTSQNWHTKFPLPVSAKAIARLEEIFATQGKKLMSKAKGGFNQEWVDFSKITIYPGRYEYMPMIFGETNFQNHISKFKGKPIVIFSLGSRFDHTRIGTLYSLKQEIREKYGEKVAIIWVAPNAGSATRSGDFNQLTEKYIESLYKLNFLDSVIVTHNTFSPFESEYYGHPNDAAQIIDEGGTKIPFLDPFYEQHTHYLKLEYWRHPRFNDLFESRNDKTIRKKTIWYDSDLEIDYDAIKAKRAEANRLGYQIKKPDSLFPVPGFLDVLDQVVKGTFKTKLDDSTWVNTLMGKYYEFLNNDTLVAFSIQKPNKSDDILRTWTLDGWSKQGQNTHNGTSVFYNMSYNPQQHILTLKSEKNELNYKILEGGPGFLLFEIQPE